MSVDRVPVEWKKFIEKTISANPSLETWKGHFQHRLPELEEIEEFWPQRRVQNALEVGCGNGLAAVYYSPLADKIVASDLPSIESQAHSIGLDSARLFVGSAGIRNIEILGCSAESIPLGSQIFDLVYGIYCLEHIPDRIAALKEARRVLRGGGEVLFSVPGFAWALFSPYGFYSELATRVANRLRKKLFPKAAQTPAGSGPIKVVSAASFFRYYPHFPLPEPHGHHSSWFAELFYYRTSNWRKLAEQAGFVEVEIIPISFVPGFLRALIPTGLLLWLEKKLKSVRAMSSLAQFYCIRAKVPREDQAVVFGQIPR